MNHATTAQDLHTIEDSHGKPRLTRPRASDLGTVETGQDRERDHRSDGTFAPGNRASVGRGARRALRAPYRAADKRVREALAGVAQPDVADVILRDALVIFEAARAELGTRSVFAQGPAIFYAVETTLAGYYMQEAGRAGFGTERGMQLHDRAQACETQASRAMTAALAATKALAGRKPKQSSVVARIERDAARMLEAGAYDDPDEQPAPAPTTEAT